MTQSAPRRLVERKGQVCDRDQPSDGGLSAGRVCEGVSLGVIYRLKVARTGVGVLALRRGGGDDFVVTVARGSDVRGSADGGFNVGAADGA